MARVLNLQVKIIIRANPNFTGNLSFDGNHLSLEPDLGKTISTSFWECSLPTLNILNLSLDTSGLIKLEALVPKNTKVLRLKSFSFEPVNPNEAPSWITSVKDIIYKDIKQGKHFKVLVNPFGGVGKAPKIFHDQVKPIFVAAGCTFEVEFTKKRYHAKEIVQGLDLNTYDAIVTVSGDGIIHEVVNGLLSRKDANQIVIPIGVIPGGSGNALSNCLLGEANGSSPFHAALNVVKGMPLKLDICSITQGKNRYFSFLSQAFGIIADLDVGFDHLRWMGSLRFTYGAIKCIMQGRRYPCEIAFKLSEDDLGKIKQHYQAFYKDEVVKPSQTLDVKNHEDVFGSVNDPIPNDWVTITDDMTLVYAAKVPWVSKDALFFPCALPSDGLVDLIIIRKDKLTKLKAFGIMDMTKNGAHINQKEVEYYKVKAFRVTPKSSDGLIDIDGEKVPFEPFQVEVHQEVMNFLSLDGKYAPTGL